MSNNMELSSWGNGRVKLAFWDYLSGNDRIFSLEPDGTVFEESMKDDDETRTVVNLVAVLRKIAISADNY